ncbi:MAG: hypothetical protein AAB434_05535 [Planctomycetota bacterium]
MSRALAALLVSWALVGCGPDAPTAAPSASGENGCPTCGRKVEDGHDCDPADRCLTCRRDVRRGHLCGVTSICRLGNPKCVFEVGHEHAHGVTHWCSNCRAEVAAGHMRNEVGRCLTRFCRACGFDAVRPDSAERLLGGKVLHVCGVTHFCPKCMTEVAENHVCDVTRYCATCKRDVSFPYCAECRAVVGASRSTRCEILERMRFQGAEPVVLPCPRCKKDVKVLDHVCFVTEFCPRCRRESPLDHSDEE